MTPTTMNALSVVACLVGAVLMWLPYKQATASLPLAWQNEAWQRDIQNTRFLSASMALAFCAVGGVMLTRMGAL
jgi:hypothetical protein